MTKPVASSILFCALETWSLTGGLQNFNRRVIRHLGRHAIGSGRPAAQILLLRDRSEDCPKIPGVKFKCAGSDRLAFILLAIRYVLGCDLLLLGHVNLLPLALLARILRPSLSVLMFVHGDEVWNEPGYRRMRSYEPWLMRCVTSVVSVSQYTAHRMGQAFRVDSNRFRLLPNAVDPVHADSAVPAKARDERAPCVLSVSRLDEGDRPKNVDKVLLAVAKLKSQIPGLRYDVVGDGPLRPELERLVATLGLANIVRFHGWIPDDQRAKAYEEATLFVLPSAKEGFGIVFLEAWQQGLPVICSSKGASAEIVSDGVDGFVVDPDNVAELTDRMRLLLSNRKLSLEFGLRGQEKVSSMYSDLAFGTRLERILAELGS